MTLLPNLVYFIKFNKLISSVLSLVLVLLLLSSVSNNISAQSVTKLSAKIEITLNVTESNNEVNQNITYSLRLQNNSADEVITRYDLADVWDSVNHQVNGYDKVSIVNLDEKLVLDFDNNPIKPNETAQINISAKTRALKKFSSARIIKHNAIREGNYDGQSVEITSYKINFPDSWEQPDIVNREILSQETKSIELTEVPRLEIAWENQYKYEIDLDINSISANTLFPILRKSSVQRIDIRNHTGLDSIYWDESGNIYTTKKDQSESDTEESDVTERLQLLVNSNLNNEHELTTFASGIDEDIQLTLPFELRQKILTNGNSNSESDNVISTITNVNDHYKVNFNSNEFSISDRGITGTDINPLEYLLTLISGLNELDYDAKVVWIDRRPFDTTREFLIEICSDSCRYYSVDPQLAQDKAISTSGLGIHLASFSGINQLVFESINSNLNYKLKDLSEATTELDSFSESSVATTIITPTRIKNFSNFPIELEVKNTGSQALFLNGIGFGGRDYPIVSNQFAGLHQGVLPGESRDFSIDNIFLPKIFFNNDEDTSVDIKVEYLTSEGEFQQKFSKQIVVEQNYWFLGLVVICIFTIIVIFWTSYEFYIHNKIAILSSFWKTRRNLDEKFWRLKQKLTMRSK